MQLLPLWPSLAKSASSLVPLRSLLTGMYSSHMVMVTPRTHCAGHDQQSILMARSTLRCCAAVYCSARVNMLARLSDSRVTAYLAKKIASNGEAEVPVNGKKGSQLTGMDLRNAAFTTSGKHMLDSSSNLNGSAQVHTATLSAITHAYNLLTRCIKSFANR